MKQPHSFWGKLCVFIIIIYSVICPVWGLLEVDVTQGSFNPHVAVVIIDAKASYKLLYKRLNEVACVVADDLRMSGVFKTPENLKHLAVATSEKRALWRKYGARFIVVIKGRPHSHRRFYVQACVYDMQTQRKKQTAEMVVGAKNVRSAGHELANTAYRMATGQAGYFDTKILYVGKRGQGQRSYYCLGLMSSDGVEKRYLKYFSSLLRTPIMSPDGRNIFYVRNRCEHRSELFYLNLKTDQEMHVRIPSDVMSVGRVGEINAFVLTTLDKKLDDGKAYCKFSLGFLDWSKMCYKRLTQKTRAIQISATADNRAGVTVFNSDLHGIPHLHTVNLVGGSIKALTSGHEVRYFSPMFSPTGKRLAFMQMGRKGFSIGVMQADGTQKHILGTFYWAESPAWVPSGNALVFVASRSATDKSQLYRVDLNSLRMVRLASPDMATAPFCFSAQETLLH